ncbi:hypothetical protein LXA43DRAFT_314540 [Ganoderma leucocontextum]|nr:hypothetical protein LXA43DRAFT_314540 [Ganoderma leucocontextum]
MLIRVLPPLPSPNILFTLSLPDPTHDAKVECPPAWRTQAMMVEELQEEGFGVEAPRDIYAMDKAAWHTALITEVVFDIPLRTTSCTFVDGSQVTWSLARNGDDDRSCLDALAAVVEDVQVSSSAMDRERARHHPDLHQQTPSPTSSSLSIRATSSAPPSPSKQHKRQKSLFSSIVAAVKGALSDGSSSRNPTLPLSLPPIKIPSSACHSHARTGSTFSRTQHSPPISPVTDRPPVPVFQLRVRPRAPIPTPPHSKVRTYSERLRHRARSRLVDIVRRHVFPMFSTTDSPSFAEAGCAPEVLAQEYGYPAGLYPAWILRSVLRRAEERMRDMIVEANAHGFGPALGYAKSLSQPAAQLRDMEDEEDDASASTSVSASVSTETDGSSVHTPTDSPVRSLFSPGIVTPPGGAPRLSSLDTKALPQVPRSPSPPSPAFDFDMPTYHTLSTMRSRLLHILARMDSSPRQISSGSSDLTVLEIKSRRRAWSCRDYVGGARMHLIGLATPVYSSPLARCESVTAESLARIQTQAASRLTPSPSVVGLADLSEFGIKLGMRAVTKEMDAQLFPVCEEEEEDEMIEHANASFYQTSSRGYSLDDDFEDDESWREVREFDLESGLLAFPHPDPPSEKPAPGPMYAHLHPMTRTRTRSMRQEPHPRLPSNALLCQPLNVKVPVPVMLNRGESLDVDVERGRGGEFTLSMDLPPPPRGWLQEDVDVACR